MTTQLVAFPLYRLLVRYSMDSSISLYSHPLALLTDLYQITMASAYWKTGVATKEAVFNLFFRENPFQGGFTIACGLHAVIDFLQEFKFDESDLSYLEDLKGNDGRPLFDAAFIKILRQMEFVCDIDAIPEGTVVFPHEPLIRVQGPIIQCQLIESILLNLVNFESLIATKSARVVQAARGDPVYEFGLRRAQGIDGSLSASRAAYVGGCSGTSNLLAGKLLGIPVKGTHAHSWVMAFDDEIEAFHSFARSLPNNCVFLVDTYDTLEGVRKAVEAGRWLRQHGHEFGGIRLDSGDLAYLSIEARKILDAAGFAEAVILASNDLDEQIITSLKDQGATINAWGVGTRLVTGYDQPALGGVYKLTALRNPGSAWEYKLKLSEQMIKISTPGILQVRRYFNEFGFLADAIYSLEHGIKDGCVIVDPVDNTRRKLVTAETAGVDLQIPIYRGGRLVYHSPAISEVRETVSRQLAQLHPGIKRFVHPHNYPVGLEENLHKMKTQLIFQARNKLL